MTSDTLKGWSNGVWNNLTTYTYAYNPNNRLVSITEQYWNVSMWVNDYQILYTYDANNNIIGYFDQTWNGIAWDTISQDIHTYDFNNYALSDAARSFNTNGTVNGGDSTHYYYHTVTGIKDLTQEENCVSVFPNPVKDELTINLNNSITNILITISVFDIYGKEILSQQVLSANTKLNTSNLPQGIYFVKVATDRDSVVKKFLKK
jgi:hypothetical protein